MKNLKKYKEFINENNKWKEILKPKPLDKVLKDLEESGYTPQEKFYFACRNGILPLVKELLKDKRIDPSGSDNYAIVWASNNGHVEVVKELLKDKRVDPSDNGNLSINWTSYNGHLEVVKELLKDERVRDSLSDGELEEYENQVKGLNESHIFEKAYIDEFLRLYDIAPQSLQNIIDKTKNIKQDKIWHPEGDVYIHSRLVTNRLSNCYNDINLNLSGFFHDLGKIDTTVFNDKKQDWSSPNHEEMSVRILNKYKKWIKEMGGDVKIIEYVVSNHMRYKYLEEMRISQQIKFFEHPYFQYVEKFSSADYGGTDLKCKEIPNHQDIKNKISQFKKQKEEDKIISSKFNGRIIMDKYPMLKGAELGNVIMGFKNSFDNFREFVLKNTKEDVMIEFDNYINGL